MMFIGDEYYYVFLGGSHTHNFGLGYDFFISSQKLSPFSRITNTLDHGL